MYGIEILTCNIAGRMRYATMAGRNYIVVPVVMLVEGVHNGSAGPLYYPADELRASVSFWDGMPVVVQHPDHGSARAPAVLNERGVGVVMNTTFIGANNRRRIPAKLVADAWLEQDRLESLAETVFTSIVQNQISEVSTGLGTVLDWQAGEFGGKHYIAIARNHRPDHLALLPVGKGACDRTAGCGLGRVHNAASHDEERPLLMPTLWPDRNAPPVHPELAIDLRNPASHLPGDPNVQPLTIPRLVFNDDPRVPLAAKAAAATQAGDVASDVKPLVAPKLWG